MVLYLLLILAFVIFLYDKAPYLLYEEGAPKKTREQFELEKADRIRRVEEEEAADLKRWEMRKKIQRSWYEFEARWNGYEQEKRLEEEKKEKKRLKRKIRFSKKGSSNTV